MEGISKVCSGARFCTECSTKRQEDELTCGKCGHAFESFLTPDPATQSIPAGKGRETVVGKTAIMNEKPTINDCETSFPVAEQTHAPQIASKPQKKDPLKQTSVPITVSNPRVTFFLFLVIAAFIVVLGIAYFLTANSRFTAY